jgi:protein-glucosylgalactosylhydroxylysine glucosidase
MDAPISPPPTVGSGRRELPAYLFNAVVGLRVLDAPFAAGMMLISGYTGEHPIRRVEAAATAPYPCAGDLKVNGVALSDVPASDGGHRPDIRF